MSLARQFIYLFGRGFTGGPEFDDCDSLELDLNGIKLAVTVPRDNVIVDDMSQKLNFPFHIQGWFEKNVRQLTNHFYVPVLAYNWAYMGPFWKVMNEPFGVLTFAMWLKRAPSESSISKDDLGSLERVIHADYEDHLEAKGEDDESMGFNTRVRRRADEMFAPKPYPTSRNLAAEKESYLQRYLEVVPTSFERRVFGDHEWVYYGIERKARSPIHHYCLPLDERYYLDAHMFYRVDFYNYFHLWKSHAEAAEQRIMSSVRLLFPT